MNQRKPSAGTLPVVLLLFVLLPLLGACDEGDDVNEIFASGTWKLTNITTEKSNQMIDLWGADEAARQRSLNLMNQPGTFTLTFYEGEGDGQASGEFDVTSSNRHGTGRWTAEGSSRALRLSTLQLTGAGETDIVAKTFLNGLQNATRYSGDSNFLYIYYEEEGQPVRRLWFIHP